MMTTGSGVLLGKRRRWLASKSARRGVMVVTAAAAAVACAGLLTGAGSAPAPDARAAVPGVQWGRAEEVPGLAKLNKGGAARVDSVSCWSVNNCAAGGSYRNRWKHSQAFVVAERNGRWDDAVEVPGTAALNKGGNANVVSVSCAPGGYCAADGYYTDQSGHSQAFVVTRPAHRWRMAVEVPGLAALNTSGNTGVASISCPSAGNCAMGGSYTGTSGPTGFVVSQASGVWGTAQQVPGLAALNVGGNDGVASLSCGSAGNCAAGGFYTSGTSYAPTGNYPLQAFVVSEENGVWGMAEEVPGTAALNLGEAAGVDSVSCARDGYCAAGGYYIDEPYDYTDVFAATASNGVWGTAVGWNGGLASGPSDNIVVSCPAAGSCALDGFCKACGSEAGQGQPFVVSQSNGVWGPLKAVPGFYAYGESTTLSCASAGNCGAGGINVPNSDPFGGRNRPFVASETNGRWANAELYPGAQALNKGRNAGVTSVSCPSAGHCTAAGWYSDAKKHQQAFVGGP
jgi:hypothetical protein